jgi:hypothetical protein
MKKNSNVIDFKPTERLVEKAGSYIESIELFLEERAAMHQSSSALFPLF